MCRHEFKCQGPMLIVAPQSGLAAWEGEWDFWVGAGANVVTYAGTQSARATIYDHEIWLSPDSLDAKSSFSKLSLPEQVCLSRPAANGCSLLDLPSCTCRPELGSTPHSSKLSISEQVRLSRVVAVQLNAQHYIRNPDCTDIGCRQVLKL